MKKVLIIFAMMFMIVTLSACDSDLINKTKGEENNTQVNTIQVTNFAVQTSIGKSVGNDQVNALTAQDIVLIDNFSQKNDVLNSYAKEYQEEISILVNEVIDENESYFSTNSIAVVPFIYSSSETNIELKMIEFKSGEKIFNVRFDLYSPEELDMDLQVKFYVIGVAKQELSSINVNELIGKIVVFNTRTGSNKSLYYGNKENQKPNEENNENTNNSEKEGEKQTRMLKISAFSTANSIVPESLHARFSEEDIISINLATQINDVVKGYKPEFQEEILNLINSIIEEKEDYFDTKTLMIVPFMHSSSEMDIILKEVKFNADLSRLEIFFELESPEELDMDLQVKFYVIELLKSELQEIELQDIIRTITVINKINSTNKSLYYGKEE